MVQSVNATEPYYHRLLILVGVRPVRRAGIRAAREVRRGQLRPAAGQRLAPDLGPTASKVKFTGVEPQSAVAIDPAVCLKIPVRALELAQILGQPCGFQVSLSCGRSRHVAFRRLLQTHSTMHLDLSGPLSRKRSAFSMQAL